MENKIIVIDWGEISHKAIFIEEKAGYPPYTACSMLIAFLKRVGVKPEDTVIIACDSHSWRKEIDKEYKSNRKKIPDEKWEGMNKLLDNLMESTKWHIMRIPELGVESDDIAAVVCRVFKDKEIILVSSDKDWEQLWSYGAKIFSTVTKRWKFPNERFNVYKLISEKVRKEISDGLVSPILNTLDYAKRLKIITLLELPKEIEDSITEQLLNLPQKKEEPILFYFDKLKPRFENLYDGNGIETEEHSRNYKPRKKKKEAKNGKGKSCLSESSKN